MESSNLYKIIAGVLVVIIFVLIMQTPSQNELFDKRIEVIKTEEYYGVVIDKFIDSKNHNDNVIVLRTRKVSLYGQQWALINVGDSLSKKKNSAIIELHKKDTVITIDQKAYIETLKKKK